MALLTRFERRAPSIYHRTHRTTLRRPPSKKASELSTRTGLPFRILNLIDDFSRQYVGQIVDTSISGARLARYLDELGTTRPLPRTLVLDNGPEFTSKAMFFWAKRTGVRLHFIQPGKPTQNAFVESFNGKFREYCLDLHWFGSLTEAREIIERWRTHYNQVRPHRSVGKMPPSVFARKVA